MNTFKDLCKIYKIFDENDEIIKLYNKSQLKKWIKLISFEDIIMFNEYNNKEYFKEVANIVLDEELSNSGKKKRDTFFKFVPSVSKKEFEEKTEWLYLLVINNKIVKIGGTRKSLKERTASYLCGHHTRENKKSGSCSNTNAFIYNTIYFYLKLNYIVKMYGYKLPVRKNEENILGEKIEIISQTYHAYESVFLKNYKKNYNNYPILNNNSDPEYK